MCGGGRTDAPQQRIVFLFEKSNSKKSKKKARFVRLEDRKGSLSLTIMLNEGEEKMSVPPPKKKGKNEEERPSLSFFFPPSMAREFTVCTATVRNAGHHCVNSLFFFSSTTDRRSNDTIAGNHMKRAHCFSGASAHAGKEKQERNLSKQVNQPRTHLERKKKAAKHKQSRSKALLNSAVASKRREKRLKKKESFKYRPLSAFFFRILV